MSYLTNPYRYVIQSTCEIADGSDNGFLGQDTGSGLINTDSLVSPYSLSISTHL